MFDLLDHFFAVGGAVVLVAWGWLRRKRKSLSCQEDVAGSTTPSALAPSLLRSETGIREDDVLLVMLVYFSAALILSAAMRALGPDDDVLTGLVINGGAQICGITACLLAAARRLGSVKMFLAGDEWAGPGATITLVFGSILVAIGICPLIRDLTAWMILQLWPEFEFEAHPTLCALDKGDLPATRVALLWVGAAVVAPVAEEVFFRGFLQGFLVHVTRPLPAVFLAAAAFAAVHFSQPHALLALFFLGLILGFSYLRTGKIYVPILIHAAFNLKTLVWESLQ